MKRSPRGAPVGGMPIVGRPALKASPSPKQAAPSMWKEFEKATETQRGIWANRIAGSVGDLRNELEDLGAAATRSNELDHQLVHMQMKFDTVYEQFILNQTLAESSDEIAELFTVDISARTRDVSCIGLPPVAEAHVAVALREWRAKIDDTPWMKDVRATLAEEAELLSRVDKLRAGNEDEKRKLEAVRRLKREGRLAACKSREEAETLLNHAMSQISVKDESEESDQEDDFLDSI